MKALAKQTDLAPEHSQDLQTANPGKGKTTSPEPSDSQIRVNTHGIIEEVVGWYDHNQPSIILIAPAEIDLERSLAFRKRLFNILKNSFLKPAFSSDPGFADHTNHCLWLRHDFLNYLSGIISNPDYDQYLPSAITRNIFDQAMNLDWTAPRAIKNLLLTIRRDLMIPPKTKKK